MAPVRDVRFQLQATVRDSFCLRGVGIHSGQAAAVTVHPADEGGIRFYRTDAPGVSIPAHVSSVRATARCTVLAVDGCQIATAEHLLAALAALGVDHARVEVDGGELPALDGSAGQYVEALQRVGLRSLGRPRDFASLSRPVWVQDGDVHIVALPAPCLRLSYVLEYPHPHIGTQAASVALEPHVFAELVAPARTFGFVEWAEELRARGLALGASVENTVVLTAEGPLSPLRYPDEFVRHKILDLLGDLALLGCPLNAHVLAVRAGHAAHVALAARILESLH